MELIKIFIGILLVICLSFSADFKTLVGYCHSVPCFNHCSVEQSAPLGLLVNDFKGRVRITDVLEYTPAKNAGLEPGDRILKINGCKVCDVKSFFEKIQEVSWNEPVNLTVYRVDSCSTFPVDVIPFGVKCK